MLSSLFSVIVNWNLWQDTIVCVESLLVAGLHLDRVIVVDNGSQNDSVARLRSHFGPALPILSSSENLGFGGGCNLGITAVLEQGAEWVLLLNNDTHVSPTFLAELTRAVELGPQFDVFGPLILYQQQPDRIWRIGDRRLFGSLMTYSPYRGAVEPERLPRLLPVDFVTGCAMLVRSEVFKVAGVFNPAIFMYGEDVDLCWRMHLAGFRLVGAPHARMWHNVSSSSNRDRRAARYLRVQNQNRFYRTYARGWQRPLMLSLSAARVLAILVRDVAFGQWQFVWPTISGWWHGWTCPSRAA